VLQRGEKPVDRVANGREKVHHATVLDDGFLVVGRRGHGWTLGKEQGAAEAGSGWLSGIDAAVTDAWSGCSAKNLAGWRETGKHFAGDGVIVCDMNTQALLLTVSLAAAGIGSAHAEDFAPMPPPMARSSVASAGAFIGGHNNDRWGQGALIGAAAGALTGAAVDRPRRSRLHAACHSAGHGGGSRLPWSAPPGPGLRRSAALCAARDASRLRAAATPPSSMCSSRRGSCMLQIRVRRRSWWSTHPIGTAGMTAKSFTSLRATRVGEPEPAS